MSAMTIVSLCRLYIRPQNADFPRENKLNTPVSNQNNNKNVLHISAYKEKSIYF